MIRPRPAHLVVVVALLLGAAGCGDDSADPPGESGTTTTTIEAADTTEAEDPAEADTSTTEPVAGGELADALLTAEDLGDGWVEVAAEEVEEEGSAFASFEDDEACEGGEPLSSPDPLDEVGTMFEPESDSDEGGPDGKVVAAVGDFAPGDAEEWMATTFGELARCAALTGPEDEAEYRVEAIEGLGDEAVGVSISSDLEGEPFMAMGVTAVRVGDRIAFVGSLARAPEDVDEEALLRKVGARL